MKETKRERERQKMKEAIQLEGKREIVKNKARERGRESNRSFKPVLVGSSSILNNTQELEKKEKKKEEKKTKREGKREK